MENKKQLIIISRFREKTTVPNETTEMNIHFKLNGKSFFSTPNNDLIVIFGRQFFTLDSGKNIDQVAIAQKIVNYVQNSEWTLCNEVYFFIHGSNEVCKIIQETLPNIQAAPFSHLDAAFYNNLGILVRDAVAGNDTNKSLVEDLIEQKFKTINTIKINFIHRCIPPNALPDNLPEQLQNFIVKNETTEAPQYLRDIYARFKQEATFSKVSVTEKLSQFRLFLMDSTEEV